MQWRVGIGTSRPVHSGFLLLFSSVVHYWPLDTATLLLLNSKVTFVHTEVCDKWRVIDNIRNLEQQPTIVIVIYMCAAWISLCPTELKKNWCQTPYTDMNLNVGILLTFLRWNPFIAKKKRFPATTVKRVHWEKCFLNLRYNVLAANYQCIVLWILLGTVILKLVNLLTHPNLTS